MYDREHCLLAVQCNVTCLVTNTTSSAEEQDSVHRTQDVCILSYLAQDNSQFSTPT